MKAIRKKDLSRALRDVAAAPEPPPAHAFWEEFRARAAITDQVATDELPTVVPAARSWAAGLAVAAAVILLAVLAVLQFPEQTTIASADAGSEPPLSEVEEVEVFADYSSVLIVEDQQNGGTVIWVAGTDVASAP